MSWFGSPQAGKKRSEKRLSGDYVRNREEGHDASLPRSRLNGDNIRSLDGLRGIACLLVFNYHFLWPWTPSIMLGYGAMLPQAPEPYWEWTSLPILCLWQRGRPMVAIFFAISGYVVSRHVLRLIHQRRLEAAYQRLASAVFRRAFRLFIPPTISMFLVALLAQAGVFKSNEAIYQGPDSAYINGTVTNVTIGARCYNHTELVVGVTGLVDYMGWQNPLPLGNATVGLCVNSTSELAGPTSVYDNAHLFEKRYARVLNDTTRLTRFENHDYISPYEGPAPLDIVNGTNITCGIPARWVQYGGMWEEHPLIHDNMTYALANFTRVYGEWANVFTFNPYHPRYDPHTFTIPMEFRGSMIVYIFLLGTAAIKAKWRLMLAGFLSAYSLVFGRWDVATFMGGTLLSDMDVRLSSASPGDTPLQPPVTDSSIKSRARPHRRTCMGVLTRWTTLVLALYLLSYPDAAAEYTPGFTFLAYLLPRYYSAIAGWSFYEAIGAMMLIPCVLRSSLLCRLLESRIPQYLGRISFSFYLMHGPVLHSLGFWIMPRLFERLGRQNGYVVGYITLLSVSLYLSNWWCKHIDRWSTTVGKRVEQMLTV
ncbi:acyltransferase 3 [Xylaria bambusicola]|uniref:acyltransferase 3 n=1 Tax=Xylaria bambusicola TaxID=326684 RepID=UPI0020081668|nr:acyltransferase 3 [Xylaria bambusicola]KAI0508437.1 acyltransferase 3 [Xylaria bambusicola]